MMHFHFSSYGQIQRQDEPWNAEKHPKLDEKITIDLGMSKKDIFLSDSAPHVLTKRKFYQHLGQHVPNLGLQRLFKTLVS